jgi:TrmH family RNA methyltransferase
MRGQRLIRSRHNPLVRRLRELKSRCAPENLCLLEGLKLIEEALAAGIEIIEAAAAPRAERSERGRALLSKLEAHGCPVRYLDGGVLESVSEVETSQGFLALSRRPAFDEARAFAGNPLVIAAVAVQNPGNVGALLRTAEAAGATGVFMTQGCADPCSWKTLRGAMGSAFRLPHFKDKEAVALVRRLRSRGLVVLAAASADGRPYDQVDFNRPTAIFLGNESAGLPQAVLDAVDGRVMVPTKPPVESLNVAVAAGVLLFEAARQRRR